MYVYIYTHIYKLNSTIYIDIYTNFTQLHRRKKMKKYTAECANANTAALTATYACLKTQTMYDDVTLFLCMMM